MIQMIKRIFKMLLIANAATSFFYGVIISLYIMFYPGMNVPEYWMLMLFHFGNGLLAQYFIIILFDDETEDLEKKQ
ncbi:Uncharacterised protein [Bacillus freudenreichii]|nr:Uncharacterised protein [Bacillus freudenreichii]